MGDLAIAAVSWGVIFLLFTWFTNIALTSVVPFLLRVHVLRSRKILSSGSSCARVGAREIKCLSGVTRSSSDLPLLRACRAILASNVDVPDRTEGTKAGWVGCQDRVHVLFSPRGGVAAGPSINEESISDTAPAGGSPPGQVDRREGAAAKDQPNDFDWYDPASVSVSFCDIMLPRSQAP